MTIHPDWYDKAMLDHQRFFHWLVSKYTRTKEEHEELLQDAYCIALKYWRGCKPDKYPMAAWFRFCVKTAAHNRVVSSKRQKRKGWTCELSENIPAPMPDYETALDLEEAKSLIANNRQGQAFKMYVLDDLELKTIAETMGVSNQRVHQLYKQEAERISKIIHKRPLRSSAKYAKVAAPA